VEWFESWFGNADYELARQVLQRGTAALYLVAFLSTLNQFPALLGERGLLPVRDFLRTTYARRQPTLFRWRYNDRLLRTVCVLGMVIAATLVVGLPQLAPPWVPLVAFLLLFVLYLSIVTVGQTFYSFGWESLILEAGFLVAFLGSNEVAPPIVTIILIRWLVFRLEFGAGMIKMRGDRSWRDLTALYYHHETQPMPNPLSRYAHLLPKWMHRGEVLGNHFAQLVVPWFLFAPQPVSTVAAAIIILTQLWLILTGNFAWLNWITVVLAFAGVGIPVLAFDYDPTPLWWIIVVLAMAALVLVLSWWPLKNLFSRHQLMNASFNRFHIVNAYGAFGSVTKERYEIIVEGTAALEPAEADWIAYEFKGKPGDPRRIPGQFAPYHLRLDWLMWFLALGSPGDRWFPVLALRLLEADGRTLRLLGGDPFGGEQPQWVRARVFHYRFATRAERRSSGLWWIRTEAGEYLRAVRLDRQ
jgi:hypothetical protein